MGAATTTSDAEMPWVAHHSVMNELVGRMRAELPELVAATVAELHRDAPTLSEALDPAFLAAGAEATNRRVLDHMAGEETDDGRFHVEVGAAAARAGVPLETVTAGYRTGARLAWAAMGRHMRELAVPADVALDLATLHVAFVDRLATDSRRGYARDSRAVEAALGVERQALVELLLGEEPPGPEALDGAARAAQWPTAEAAGAVHDRVSALPARVAVGVALAPLGVVPPAALAGRHGGAVILVVAEDALAALEGLPVACGPLVPVEQAGRSLAGARRLARLALSGTLDATGTLRWEDHLLALIAHAEPLAAAALAERVLAPLAGVTPAHATLLRETLVAWLRHPGRPQAIAAELHLHPQSVRYRIARLRERFGAALDDPDARLELQVALLAGG